MKGCGGFEKTKSKVGRQRKGWWVDEEADRLVERVVTPSCYSRARMKLIKVEVGVRTI